MIVTVTNNIDGQKITHYIKTINANVVLGINIFSDFSASLTDIFGGKSHSYMSKLDLIYESLIKQLEEKGRNLEADAIVGLKIDFDEITGKGTQMLMANAVATAVKTVDENKFSEMIDEIKETEVKKFTEINEVAERMKQNQEQIGYSKRIGDKCVSCAYTGLTSFDKACPKCKKVFR